MFILTVLYETRDHNIMPLPNLAEALWRIDILAAANVRFTLEFQPE